MNAMKMKLIMTVFLFTFASLQAWANLNSTNTVFVDWGSIRNTYFYPSTDIGYNSPDLFGTEGLKAFARMRSYGTFYFFSRYSYDFTVLGEYHYSLIKDNALYSISVMAGAGLEARVRLVNDIRSTATGGVEPIVMIGAEGSYWNFGLSLPLWAHFYLDGAAFILQPEVSYHFMQFGVFIRSEIAFLTRYDIPQSEWTWNNYAGVSIDF